MATRLITVRCEGLPDVTSTEIAAFVADALSTWGGQRHPEDPLFNSLDVRSVTVGLMTIYFSGDSDEA